MSCERHPLTYGGLNPEDFSKFFNLTVKNYKHEFLEELTEEYKRQSEQDKKGNRPQLASKLENLATAIYLTSKYTINTNEKNSNKDSNTNNNTNNDNNYLNTKSKELATTFGNTNYFYQMECFKLIKEELPKPFELAIKAMNKVCKVCEKYMHDPYNKNYQNI